MEAWPSDVPMPQSFMSRWSCINHTIHSIFIAAQQHQPGPTSAGSGDEGQGPLFSTLDVMKLYQLVYDLLISCEEEPAQSIGDRITLVFYLLWLSMWSWVKELAHLSGGHIGMPTCIQFTGEQRRKLPEDEVMDLSYTVEMDVLHSSFPEFLALRYPIAPLEKWRELVMDVCSTWNTDPAPLTPPHMEHTALATYHNLHALCIFTQQVEVMKNTLSIGFLRLHRLLSDAPEGVGAHITATQVLRSVVGQVLHHNHFILMDALGCVAQHAIGTSDVELSGSTWVPDSPTTTHQPFPEEVSAQLPRPLADLTAPFWHAGCVVRVAQLLRVVESCQLFEVLQGMSRQLIHCCHQRGAEAASLLLGSSLSCSTSTATQIAGAIQALREVLHSYERLRGRCTLINTGTLHFMRAGTPRGQQRIVDGLRAFLHGLSEDGTMRAFVQRWGVQLWVNLCEEARVLRHAPRRLASTLQSLPRVGGEGTSTGSVPTEWESEADRPSFSEARSHSTLRHIPADGEGGSIPNKMLPSSWIVKATMSSVFDHAEDGAPDADEDPAQELHNMAHAPTDGFPTLLFLLPPDASTRTALMSVFRLGVHQYFSSMLDESKLSASKDDLVRVAVLDRCRYFLRMTEEALQMHKGKAPPPSEMPVMDEDVSCTLHDNAASTSTWQLTSTYVKKGISDFLMDEEEDVVRLIAQAIYDVRSSMHREDRTRQPDAAHTDPRKLLGELLQLAVLLHRKEVLLDAYVRLVVSHFMHVRRYRDLSSDEEIGRMMQQYLGRGPPSRYRSMVEDARRFSTDAHASRAVRLMSEEVGGDTHGRSSLPNQDSAREGGRLPNFRALPVGRYAATYFGRGNPREVVSNAVAQAPPFMKELRVLCKAWWSPYISTALSGPTIRKLHEEEGWFCQKFVDAVLRTEWHYDSSHDGMWFEGYGKYALPKHARTASMSTGDRLASSVASLSQSTSSIVQGFSTVLQHGGTRIYGNLQQTNRRSGALGNDDVDDDEADFQEAYGGVLRGSRAQPASTITDSSWTDGGASPLGTGYVGGEKERQLHWPLTCGKISFILSAPAAPPESGSPTRRGRRRDSVCITGPPLLYALLQLLSGAITCASFQPHHAETHTFDIICNALPGNPPKGYVAFYLQELLRCGLVERTACRCADGSRRYAYSVVANLQAVPGGRVEIKSAPPILPSRVAGAAVEATPADKTKDGPPHHTAYRERMEACIVHCLKTVGEMSHQSLFSESADSIPLPAPEKKLLFKDCIQRLITRDLVGRAESGTYKYVV